MQNQNYDNDNIFAKIIRGEIPCSKVFENDKILAFNDINPKAPVHILIIPKKSCICFHDFVLNSTKEEVGEFFATAQEIAEDLREKGEIKDYRIVSNCGEEAGQVVFHFHLHLMGYK